MFAVAVYVVCLLPRQVDDLQFQLEEQNVISGDQLETAAESSGNTLARLTRQLQEEKKTTSKLHGQIKVGPVSASHACADTHTGWGFYWSTCSTRSR